MTNIQNKIEKLGQRTDELLKEIGILFNEGKQKEANELYNGEYNKLVKELFRLSKKEYHSL